MRQARSALARVNAGRVIVRTRAFATGHQDALRDALSLSLSLSLSLLRWYRSIGLSSF
jgi:hypothetical protein